MKIRKLRKNSADQNWDGWHILTVAESGFSVLQFFAEKLGVDGESIHRFADRINQTNESDSLHPRAPISAIPCKYLRELADQAAGPAIEEFKRHIEDFIKANEKTIRAPRILVDFHVSSDSVSLHFVKATEEVFMRTNSCAEEIVIAV